MTRTQMKLDLTGGATTHVIVDRISYPKHGLWVSPVTAPMGVNHRLPDQVS